ncbi:hypothetical protein CDL15_Pgr019444 [Punica granatum]|uniref:Leucine-rich repeat-containing N-terminal plant-type domain-containing protein n=1 Tax=Punica granatum TaxID=22663 RepID=A0A218XSQ8_PUNGR|nr:hypothetical protein CDL15_Pgr019444 [Punica granatum]
MPPATAFLLIDCNFNTIHKTENTILKVSNCSLLLSPDLCLSPVVAAFSLTSETDKQALLEFKNHVISGSSDNLSSWSNLVHFCAWTCVMCGEVHYTVTTLKLNSLRLVGQFHLH